MADGQQEKLYLDTSVVSAYGDARKADRQAITQRWWKQRLFRQHDVYVSEVTVDELAATPDTTKRGQFKQLLKGIHVLDVTPNGRALADAYIEAGVFAEEDYNDALHLAVATVHGMDIVASWNFHHLVNHETRRAVRGVNLLNGYRELQIESPLELGGDQP